MKLKYLRALKMVAHNTRSIYIQKAMKETVSTNTPSTHRGDIGTTYEEVL